MVRSNGQSNPCPQAVSPDQGPAPGCYRFLPAGRLLRDFRRGRGDRCPRTRPRPDLAPGGQGPACADGRRSPPRCRRVHRPPHRKRLPRRHRRAGGRGHRQGADRPRGDARRDPRHRRRAGTPGREAVQLPGGSRRRGRPFVSASLGYTRDRQGRPGWAGLRRHHHRRVRHYPVGRGRGRAGVGPVAASRVPHFSVRRPGP